MAVRYITEAGHVRTQYRLRVNAGELAPQYNVAPT
jgi:hypothetical protein